MPLTQCSLLVQFDFRYLSQHWFKQRFVVCHIPSHYLNKLLNYQQYGPVTMIAPASGHQVRCIPWVQMGTFNKEIGFLCRLKFFALNIFREEYLQSSLHLMLQIW